jgi:hypothetical protein
MTIIKLKIPKKEAEIFITINLTNMENGLKVGQ